MATEETSGGGIWGGFLDLAGKVATYDLNKDAIKQEQLAAQYNLLEAQAEQQKAADVNSPIIGLSFFQANQSTIIIAGALLFSGLMIYKVLR